MIAQMRLWIQGWTSRWSVKKNFNTEGQSEFVALHGADDEGVAFRGFAEKLFVYKHLSHPETRRSSAE